MAYVKVRFPSGDVNDNVWFHPKEESEIPGSRGTANLVIKQKGSKQWATIQSEGKEDYPDYEEKNNDWKTYAYIDCRGLEVTDWIVNAKGFTAETPSGEIVDDIEFEDGEYYGYDEKAETDTSILNIETRVIKASKGSGGKRRACKRK
eukprot:CAMPEP_0185251530 /NCGR_PEP_ID=MMETSP1359-20130426/914_1 /TAXON_ID=552665 /ORGANISM="Bigelowiella longifila, Strain CCMP242" /LENGTH=147 /DNA_ID=CAMNT_0027833457 /DNA_START=53 /DNA_END=497 /DNA_ORIENTATION=+